MLDNKVKQLEDELKAKVTEINQVKTKSQDAEKKFTEEITKINNQSKQKLEVLEK